MLAVFQRMTYDCDAVAQRHAVINVYIAHNYILVIIQ